MLRRKKLAGFLKSLTTGFESFVVGAWRHRLDPLDCAARRSLGFILTCSAV